MGKCCKVCGVVTLQVLLLVWVAAGACFSALTLGTCQFLYTTGVEFPPAVNDDGSGNTRTPTGQIGLFLYNAQDETTSGSTYQQCRELPGSVSDQFGIYFQISRLMGVVALAIGGVAAIVLVITFFMEMCCAVSGLNYGLGIMLFIACACQGLTFLSLMDNFCSQYGCRTDSSAIWSGLGCAMYFIAMLQAFIAPFPKERICSKATCCSCCSRKHDDEDEEEDVEAQQKTLEEEEQPVVIVPADDDAAPAAAAGVATGAAAGAAVTAAVIEEDEAEEENVASKEDVQPVPAPVPETAVDDDGVDMTVLDDDYAAIDREEAAAQEAAAAAAASTAAESAVKEDEEHEEPKTDSAMTSASASIAEIFQSAKSLLKGETDEEQ